MMQVLIVVVPTFPCLIRQYSCTSIIVHIYVRTYLDHYILVRILPSYYSCVRVYYAPQVSIVRNTPWSQCSGVSRVLCFARVLVVAGWGCGPMTRRDFRKRTKKKCLSQNTSKVQGERVKCPRRP